MNLIETKDDLRKNLTTFASYITKGENEAHALLQRGTCFVVFTDEQNRLRFAPSRFIGYVGNNLSKHTNNTGKDGRDTNPRIVEVLGDRKAEIFPELEDAYLAHCHELGITPRTTGSFGVRRKYWDCRHQDWGQG